MDAFRNCVACAALGSLCAMAWGQAGDAAPVISPPLPHAAGMPARAIGVPDVATLNNDQAMVTKIMSQSQTQGYVVIAARKADLESVLAHAPGTFHQMEDRGASIYVRSVDAVDCMTRILTVVSQRKAAHLPGRYVICVNDPYPLAGLLLGSYYNQINQPMLALTALDRGLVWAPNNPDLAVEKGASMNVLHRSAVALQIFSNGLTNSPTKLSPEQSGRLLRGQGYALTELGRFEEAEQAYRRSLELDPNHGHAIEELSYIARVKAGGRPTATLLTGGFPATQPPNR